MAPPLPRLLLDSAYSLVLPLMPAPTRVSHPCGRVAGGPGSRLLLALTWDQEYSFGRVPHVSPLCETWESIQS
jgi:hypothetical protein